MSIDLDKLRSVGVSLPGRPIKPGKHPRQPMNSWERGFPTSLRPDGTRMPYLDNTGSLIGQKEWAEFQRRKFQEAGLA